jgi:N-acetylglucosamine kinase-like BadF-type ATPase
MIIVADSGSTKTDWKLYNNVHGVREIETPGLNPYFLTDNEIALILKKEVQPFLDESKVRKVFFYGSGCSHPDKINEIDSALSDFFTHADIVVESDLLGAARALCGDKAGIVAILGTGSNSCVYDGSAITNQILSLGYILGDEGSGAVLGKKVLKSALSGKMPHDLLSEFRKEFVISTEMILNKVYSKPFPNRFLATYAPFAVKNMDHEWMKMLLHQHFTDFFDEMITVYENFREHTLNLSGSLAWHLHSLLKELCAEYNMSLGNVISRPIDDLLRYHLDRNPA